MLRKLLLILFVLGLLLAAQGFIRLSLISEKDKKEAMDVLTAVLDRKKDQLISPDHYFYDQLGTLRSCREGPTLNYSVSPFSSYPITWTGLFNCMFTKSDHIVEVEVKEYKDAWETNGEVRITFTHGNRFKTLILD